MLKNCIFKSIYGETYCLIIFKSLARYFLSGDNYYPKILRLIKVEIDYRQGLEMCLLYDMMSLIKNVLMYSPNKI